MMMNPTCLIGAFQRNASLAALAAAVLAWLVAPACLMAQEVPFVGQITHDNVVLRANAGNSYYIVGHGGKGTRVVVTQRIADWYKITPPSGVYSYVAKAYIEVRGDGSTGTARQRLQCYAASVTGPGESYRRQLDLLAGDVVKIVAQEGDYFKIEPPKGAYVYIPTQFIEHVADAILPEAASTETKTPEVKTPEAKTPEAKTPETQTPDVHTPDVKTPEVKTPQSDTPQVRTPAAATPSINTDSTQPQSPDVAATTQTTTPTATQPATQDTTQTTAQTATQPTTQPATQAATETTTTATTTVTTTTTTLDQDTTLPRTTTATTAATKAEQPQRPLVVSPDLLAAENAFYDAQKLPVEKQPLDELIAQYRKLQPVRSLTAGDQRVISARLAQLQRNAALAKAINDLQEVRRELRPSTTILVPPPQPTPAVTFDAMGVLLASSVYDGVTLPRLYRLVTAGDGRTIAYIRPTAAFDVTEALGSTVGIVGQTRLDPALSIRVIDAQRLVILEPATPPEQPTTPATTTTPGTTPTEPATPAAPTDQAQ